MESAAAGRDEPGSHARAKAKPTISVETNQDGMEAVSPGRVTANYQLLRELDAHLDPCAGPSSLLVSAGKSLDDDSFEPLTPGQFKHLLGRNAEAFRELNSIGLSQRLF